MRQNLDIQQKQIVRITFIFILISTLLFRLPSFTTSIWNGDEAVSACVANTILDGGLPYRDSVDHRGPVTYYLYALIFALFGRNNMLAIHLTLTVMIIIMAFLLYRCGKFRGNYLNGIIAASLFTILSHNFVRNYDMLAFHTEHALIFFELLAVNFLLDSIIHGNYYLTTLSGVCYALAVFSKQPAFLDFLGCGIFLCFIAYRVHLNRKETFWLIGSFFLGFIALSFSIIAYFWLQGGFLDFWLYVWEYNMRYYIPSISLGDRLLFSLSLWWMQWQKFSGLFILLGASIVFLLFNWREHLKTSIEQDKSSRIPVQLLWLIWMLTSVVASSLSGRRFGHYLLQTLPAICLITANWGNVLITLFRKIRGQRLFRNSGLIHITVIILCSLSVLQCTYFLYLRFRESIEGYDFPSVIKAGAYLTEQSTPTDRIFVWGFLPEIYIMSNRLPASRFTYVNVLTGLIPWTNVRRDIDTSNSIVPETWDIFMNELITNPPLFIIDTSPSGIRYYDKYPLRKFPRLQRFIQEQYLPVDQIIENEKPMFTIFKRKQ